MNANEPAASIWPVCFAVGVAVLLVGLVVAPVVALVGAGIAATAAVFWVRGDRRREPAAPEPAATRREERFPRSRLLERATLALGGLVALGVAVPAAGVAVVPALFGRRRREVELGRVDSFPEGRFVVATFLADPQQGEISRRAAYVRNNGALGKLPSFTIMSSRCTHVGCPTQPNGPVLTQERTAQHTAAGEVGLVPVVPAGGFGCPCHGSQFDAEGNRTAGPAPRALDRYEFSIRDGSLWVGRLYSVARVEGSGADALIHRVPLRGAGEPADGLESLLYPLDPESR